MEYNSGTKNKDILPFATTWMYHMDIMLSEISQTEKNKYLCDIIYTWALKKPNS